MMNDLLNRMSVDMSIRRFKNESEGSFVYRLCYSALGQWCLSTAQCSFGANNGTTKHSQTIVMNDLIARFSKLFPFISNRFIDTSNQQVSFPVHIRRVYEETGYLLTDDSNRNNLANFGRCIQIGSKSLFFGLPNTSISMNGLGMYTNPTKYSISTKDFLIRDNLTCEEFFHSRFDPIDFYDRDINLSDLEFFNPKSNNAPSQSWGKKIETDCTVARKFETGPFYRVMKMSDDSLQFVDEPVEQQNDSFISYEYRRLYFALKAHYGKHIKATITKLDDVCSRISLRGHLPNREYYFFLLISWPEKNAFDKLNFIIQNDFLPEAITSLTHIGIEIIGGQPNA